MKIKITSNIHNFITNANNYHIKIKLIKNNIYFIKASDLEKLIKYCPSINYEIMNNYTLKGLYQFIRKKIILFIMLIFFIMIYYFSTNVIIKVKINEPDKLLHDNIKVSLKNYGLKPFSYRLNYNQIENIKKKLLHEYNDQIEWLEIKRIGMKYEVSIVKRIKTNSIYPKEFCNVYASKEGLIKKVIYDKGELVVEKNDLVNEGDLLISGEIKKDDVTKNITCANGDVYAEVWYKVTINYPLTTTKQIKTGKETFNIYYNDHPILKNKYLKFDIKNKFKIAKLRIVKERELTSKTINNSIDNIDPLINKLIEEKFNVKLSNNEYIIEQKVLKKSQIDSKINIEVFVSVLENIASIKEESWINDDSGNNT